MNIGYDLKQMGMVLNMLDKTKRTRYKAGLNALTLKSYLSLELDFPNLRQAYARKRGASPRARARLLRKYNISGY